MSPPDSAVFLEQVRDIYLGNLDYSVTEQDIRNIFERFGCVVSVVVPIDYATGQSQGFAFVKMNDMISARRAFTELAGKQLKNRRLRLGWSYR